MRHESLIACLLLAGASIGWYLLFSIGSFYAGPRLHRNIGDRVRHPDPSPDQEKRLLRREIRLEDVGKLGSVLLLAASAVALINYLHPY